jgi:hypothetical protein
VIPGVSDPGYNASRMSPTRIFSLGARASRLTPFRRGPNAGFSLLAVAGAVVLLLLGCVAGCRVVDSAARAPGQIARSASADPAEKPVVDPVELQQVLLRFAGEFSTQMIVGVDQLRQGPNPISPADALVWKITLVAEPCSIVSGANTLSGLLDLTVLITLMRSTLEDYWQPKVFGESARTLTESCRLAETGIWEYTDKVLTREQRAELRRAIDVWRRQNPLPESVLSARAQGFTSRLAQVNASSASKTGSVFGLLRLDPFSGLDPATREIAESRLFAERALFVFQRMPMLLRWQTELTALNAAAMPAVQQLVTNSTQIAESVDRFSRVAEQLPRQLSTEREEILRAFEKQEQTLAPIVSDVRGALTAGTQMSASLNTTITTFDGLMKRFGVGEPKPDEAPAAKGEPFRIKDYAETAAQLEQMSLRLTELIRTFDQTLGSPNLSQLAAQVKPVVQQAQAGGKEVVDYAFWRGMMLVGSALAAALAYRFLAMRLSRPTQSKQGSS